jgi:hypothetical protein
MTVGDGSDFADLVSPTSSLDVVPEIAVDKPAVQEPSSPSAPQRRVRDTSSFPRRACMV